MVWGISAGARRKQERAEVAHVARRRLELLEAELAGLRPRRGVGADGVSDWAGAGGVGDGHQVRAAGRHVAQPAPVAAPPPAPSSAVPVLAAGPAGQRGRVRAGPPGDLLEPDDEPWWVAPPLVAAGLGAGPVAVVRVPPAPAPVATPAPRLDETGHLTRLDAALALAPVDDDPLGPGRPPLRVVGPAAPVEPDPADLDERRGPWSAFTGWIEDRLPPSLQGRVRLSGPGVVVVVGALALALVAVTWMTVWSPGGEEVPGSEVSRVAAVSSGPEGGTAAGQDGAAGAGAGASPSSGASDGASAVVVVDVAGKVRRPGIVTLPAGSRVHQAVARAGGARAGVDLTGLNLARVLVDGEQIVVGRKGGAAAGPGTPGAGVGGGAGAGAGAEGALVDLNTASAEQLDTLPGVGEVTARKILEWRTTHGTFTSVDELLEIDGIGEKTLADIKPRATV